MNDHPQLLTGESRAARKIATKKAAYRANFNQAVPPLSTMIISAAPTKASAISTPILKRERREISILLNQTVRAEVYHNQAAIGAVAGEYWCIFI